MVAHFIEEASRKVTLALGRRPTIAYLPDGPYGIPVETA